MTEESTASRRSRLIIIDDDRGLCDLLIEFLRTEGFDVCMSHSAEHGVHRVLTEQFDLVMLDVMLPGMNGFDALRRIRAESSVPVLMLTAKGEDIDRIVGLELGADDYLPKPFNTRELLARVHAILRRTRQSVVSQLNRSAAARTVVDDVELDPGARIVRQAGNIVELTGIEFDLLYVLLQAAGQVVPREKLFKEVLGRRPMPDDRSLDMHVSNLRKKLGHKVGPNERIKTVRGHGYVYTRTETDAGEAPESGDEQSVG